MHTSEQVPTSCPEIKTFLSNSYSSKEQFLKRYKKLIESKVNPKHLYLQIISELEEAISKGNLASFKRFGKLIDYFGGVETTATLKSYYNDIDNTFKTTNLVILACKHNRIEILRYIFNNVKVFENLFIDDIAPSDKDETCHNAFYYAVRSQNVDLLDTLINNWPGDYFTSRSAQLDEILSRAYEELKLKNVALSDEMEIFIESKIINLRFFTEPSGQLRSTKNHLSNIIERVNLLLEKIEMLKNEYSNDDNKIDATFLFIGRFIAQNIHVLKRQLRLTYDRLPWEEIEFCLVAFLSSYAKPREINLFYRSVLNKKKILLYLENFACKLAGEISFIQGLDVRKLGELPHLSRNEASAKVTRDCAQFVDLYSDHQQIRDIRSLERISTYLNLALKADPKQRQGQLIIIRALQVIGEYLKNTLESPNLSNETSELLLLSLPKHTRRVITDLRNSLSHANSLVKRTEIEDVTDVKFFKGVQNDIKLIDNVVIDILYKNKVKTIEATHNILTGDTSLEEKKAVAEILSDTDIDKINLPNSNHFHMSEVEKLEKLVKKMNAILTKKVSEVENWFDEINTILTSAKTKSQHVKFDYKLAFLSLKSVAEMYTDPKPYQVTVEGEKNTKIVADKALESFMPRIESHSLKKIVELSRKITLLSQHDKDIVDEINSLDLEIFHIAQFSVSDIKWIEKLRGRLSDKGIVTKQNKMCDLTKDECDKQLAQKLSELKSVFNQDLSGDVVKKLPSYKKNKELLAVVEMLVLDIMSLLSRSDKYLENNQLFVDDNYPLLMGKCLRNHLAHGNTLLDLLLSDSSAAVILNAEKLVSENIVQSKKKVGKLVPDNPTKVNQKYDHDLAVITTQEKMFAALLNEDIEKLRRCLLKGADIHGRTISLSTTLHLAARGTNVELVKFVVDQKVPDNVRDSNGQTPLHVAASHGRKNIVQFFLSRSSISVNDTDKHRRRTPLHWAAKNGHDDVVEILLENNASTDCKDKSNQAPVHYAIENKHVSVAKTLLSRERDMDKNESVSGFTSLQLAAQSGCLELVEFLIEKGASVYKKNDNRGTALHPAVYYGYLDIVELLIRKGSDVNAKLIDGSTPLHYASEHGHQEIAELLLKHGANVDDACRTFNNTALHLAARDGYESTVELLLKNKAKVDVRSKEGITPLYLAVQNNHLKVVEKLLKHGANINASNDRGHTALHCAVEWDRNEIAEVLIHNRAKLDVKDSTGATPLHRAALKGNEHLVDMLIKNNADVSDRDNEGYSVIFAAAQGGCKPVVEILLNNKAQINSKTPFLELTPLHLAAQEGHYEIVELLLERGANVNAKDAIIGRTPLYPAASQGHKEIVNLLIKNGANVRMNSALDSVMHAAVAGGNSEIVEILLKKGADVNFIANNRPPLMAAVHANNKDIAEILLKYGADINVEKGEPLMVSVVSGFQDMVELLLRKNARVNVKRLLNLTMLHHAATRGHIEIANMLISYGADVNAACANGCTPLDYAAESGHSEVIELLISKGARIRFDSTKPICLPLVAAIEKGYVNVVDVLLRSISQPPTKQFDHMLALHLAVVRGHLPIVKRFMREDNVNLNDKSIEDNTLLHFAVCKKNLEMIKYLVNNGSDIRAKNTTGFKPIHTAVEVNFKEGIEYFLSLGMNIEEPLGCGTTLLNLAVVYNHPDLAKFLIAKGANVNAKDNLGITHIHQASSLGHENLMQILLENGAVYNALNNNSVKPIDWAGADVTFDKGNFQPIEQRPVFKTLSLIDQLFEAIKRNCASDVEKCIKAGAFVNAKTAGTETTPLHYAAWKGSQRIVNILLKNKANTNAVCSKGFTALHYAAKYAHLECVKILLSHGAIYNVSSYSGKTPLDLAINQSIIDLFKIIDDSFRMVKCNNSQVIINLNEVKEDDLKAIMNARNRDNRSLIAAASRSNFTLLGELKSVCQGNVLNQIKEIRDLILHADHQRALANLSGILEKRKRLFGADNPATLDIETWVGKVLYKQGNYQKALDLFERLHEKQKEVLGFDDKATLETRSGIALVLYAQGKDKESVKIYRETYAMQKKILGSNDEFTLSTQFHMAAPLLRLGKLEEAFKIYEATFKRVNSTRGATDLYTISAQNNMANVLSSLGKHEEALRTYQDVYEKKKLVLGVNHADTLRTMHNIASVYEAQKKHQDAVKILEEVASIQKRVLMPNHPDYLHTRYFIANVLFLQSKYNSAWKIYKECYDQTVAVYGPNHPTALDISQRIEVINLRFRFEGTNESQREHYMQTEVNIAVSNNDIPTINRLLKQGADVNETDIEGRAPIHYAVENRLLNVINLLLENSVDITQATNKGNTPLHTAAVKNYPEIAQILLVHVDRDKLHDFINAKTSSSGMTALHVAAKKGYSKVVKLLLTYNATYDVLNKEGKTPLDLASDQIIIELFKKIEEIFKLTQLGNVQVVNKLKALNPDDISVVTNARNRQGHGLLQVAIVNG